MKNKILGIIKTQTFKSTSLVTGATIVNGMLGFVFFWFMARALQPALYGIFSVAITTAGLLTDFGAVGTETGVVNFVGKFIKTDYEKALRFLKLALQVKLIVSFLILVIGWFLMPIIAVNLLGNSDLILPLRFSLFAAVSGLLFGFATSSLQSLQKFLVWALLNISANAGRLILIFIFFVLGILTINLSLSIYILIPFIGFLVSFLFLPNFFKIKNEVIISRDFFNYNKWVAVFTLIAALTSRLDIFFVTRISGLTQAGVYSVAVILASVIPQIVGAIGTVIAPKLAGFNNHQKAIIYLKKLQLFVFGLSFAGIISGTIIGYFFIHHFYRQEYFSSFLPFTILLLAQAVFLFSLPVHMATIYYFSYPKLFVLVSFVDLIIVVIGCFVLIPIFGISGASIAVLLGNISNFIIPGVWVWIKFKKS